MNFWERDFMKFTKMQGLGNDYIYFNCMEKELKNPEKLSVYLSRPHLEWVQTGL